MREIPVAVVPDRKNVSGGLYQGHWSRTRTTIEALIEQGETNLSRLVAATRQVESTEASLAMIKRFGYRIAGTISPGHVQDHQLAINLFDTLKFWYFLRAIPADTTDIVELGSGYGANLFSLWLNGAPAKAKYHGLEYTSAGRDCADRLAGFAPGMTFRSAPFDFYTDTLAEFAAAPKLVMFTCLAIEQITYIPTSFFNNLLALPNLHTVVHVEPVGWQYDLPPDADAQAVEIDQLMRKSVAQKGYNQNLVSELKTLAAAGRIVIEDEQVHFGAGRPDLPLTAIRWRPVR